MIISDRLGSSALVDAAQPQEHVDASCEAAARGCIRSIVRMGEESGAFIRPESVWVTRRPYELEPDRVMVCVEWSPDPAEGVELRGGPLGGEVLATHREPDGRPARLLLFPKPPPVPTPADPFPTEPWQLAETYSYELAGIDSERDRWVYLHRP